jgi:hypothetical protein
MANDRLPRNGLSLAKHEELNQFKLSVGKPHDIAQQIKPHLEPGIPFYSVHNYEQTLPFYIKRPVTLVAYADELAFGLKQEPALWLPDIPAFVKAWHGHARALAIIEPSTYAKLEKEGLPMQVIATHVRYAVVKKPVRGLSP